MFGLRRVEPAVKRREMSCSRAPRVFAGRRLSRFCFSAVWHFLSVAAAAPVPLFHSERDRRDGGSWAAKQENMRCMPRDCVLLWVEDWDEGARGERERANRGRIAVVR